MSLEEALRQQSNLEDLLSKNGFVLDTTDREYSLYDSNPYTDSGWMFKNNDIKDFITESDDNLAYHAPASFVELVKCQAT